MTIGGKTLQQAILEFRRRPDVIEYVAKRGVTLKNSGIKREFNRLITMYRNRAQDRMIANSPNLLNRRDVADAMAYAESANDVDKVDLLKGQLEELVKRAQKGY